MYDFFPLIIGFVGSLHCLGMCGPLVFAYSIHLTSQSAQDGRPGSIPWYRTVGAHLSFHAGRIVTYAILGGAAAALFQAADLSRLFSNIRYDLTLAGGVLLVVWSLVFLRLVPVPSFLASAAPVAFFAKSLQRLFHSRTWSSKLCLGMATGTVPCCLSWAMIITAATTHEVLRGCFTMILFGLGTVPALFIAGLSTTVVSAKIRSRGETATALLILLMGIVLILKGVKILD